MRSSRSRQLAGGVRELELLERSGGMADLSGTGFDFNVPMFPVLGRQAVRGEQRALPVLCCPRFYRTSSIVCWKRRTP
jgi:hypothetical protein